MELLVQAAKRIGVTDKGGRISSDAAESSAIENLFVFDSKKKFLLFAE